MAQRRVDEVPGYRAVRDDYDTLVEGIQSPAKLADRLFSKYLITDEIRDKVGNLMFDRRTRNRELLAAVESKLKSEPASFHVFVAVINEEQAYQGMVQKLTNSYEKHNAQKMPSERALVRDGSRVASHSESSRAKGELARCVLVIMQGKSKEGVADLRAVVGGANCDRAPYML